MQKVEKIFIQVAKQSEDYNEIKDKIRELHCSEVLSDNDYNYILENWDVILKKNNL